MLLLDELLQPKTETDVSRGRHQQDRTHSIQAPSDKRLVVAPSAFPGVGLAPVRLPGHSQLRHLHPSPASAVEPSGLCCILDCGAGASPSLLNWSVNISVVCTTAEDKDFVVCVRCSPAAQAGSVSAASY